MKNWLIVLLVPNLTTCAYIDILESISEQELRVEYPKGKLKDNGPYYMGIPVKDCYRYYDKGMSTQWQECMGVEPK